MLKIILKIIPPLQMMSEVWYFFINSSLIVSIGYETTQLSKKSKVGRKHLSQCVTHMSQCTVVALWDAQNYIHPWSAVCGRKLKVNVSPCCMRCM